MISTYIRHSKVPHPGTVQLEGVTIDRLGNVVSFGAPLQWIDENPVPAFLTAGEDEDEDTGFNELWDHLTECSSGDEKKDPRYISEGIIHPVLVNCFRGTDLHCKSVMQAIDLAVDHRRSIGEEKMIRGVEEKLQPLLAMESVKNIDKKQCRAHTNAQRAKLLQAGYEELERECTALGNAFIGKAMKEFDFSTDDIEVFRWNGSAKRGRISA